MRSPEVLPIGYAMQLNYGRTKSNGGAVFPLKRREFSFKEPVSFRQPSGDASRDEAPLKDAFRIRIVVELIRCGANERVTCRLSIRENRNAVSA